MIDSRPAIVGSRNASVDLLKLATDIIDQHVSGLAKGKCERVATAPGPDGLKLTTGFVAEGIVFRNRTIGVDAKNLSLQRVHHSDVTLCKIEVKKIEVMRK